MKSVKNIITFISFLFLGIASTNAATIYATTDIGQGLATIDMGTGSGPFKGYFSGFPPTFNAAGLAFTPDGTLWTMAQAFTNARLATVNKVSGLSTDVGAPTGMTGQMALASDSAGNLIAATGSFLYSVDKATGAFTQLGTVFSTIPLLTNDMSFDAADILYAVSNLPNELHTFDAVNGGVLSTIPIVGLDPNGSAEGLMIDKATGTAYLIERITTGFGSNLYSLNLVSGQATFIAAINVSDTIPHFFVQQGDIGAAVAGGSGASGAGGGGCSVATNGQPDPTLLLMLLLSVVSMLLRKRFY